jgi:hypothetical protein
MFGFASTPTVKAQADLAEIDPFIVRPNWAVEYSN